MSRMPRPAETVELGLQKLFGMLAVVTGRKRRVLPVMVGRTTLQKLQPSGLVLQSLLPVAGNVVLERNLRA